MASKPRVKIPKDASTGDVITIKTLIKHQMENGHRIDAQGNTVPRDIINYFEAAFNGNRVFHIDLGPSVAQNPYIEFPFRVTQTGTFVMKWIDDAGIVIELRSELQVNG